MSHHHADDAFAPTLRRLRMSRRLSQERLAERCGIDHSAVSKVESGTREPTRDMVGKLVAGLGLPPDQGDRLYTLAGYVPSDLPLEHVVAALQIARTATPETLDATLALLARQVAPSPLLAAARGAVAGEGRVA